VVYTESLAQKICQGLRPQFQTVKVPQLLKDLVKRCLDADPLKRPNAGELNKILGNWFDENTGSIKKDTEFYRQCKEIKDVDNHKLVLSSQLHSSTFRTSRLLDFKNLPEPQNNPSQEWQTSTLLDLQIKAIKEQTNLLKESLDNESKELVDNFIQAYQEMLTNEEDEQAMDKVGELEEQLKKKGIAEQKIEEISRYCEDLVDLEKKRQTKNEEIQTEAKVQQVNFPPFNKNS